MNNRVIFFSELRADSFTALRAKFKVVRFFYAFIWAYEGITKSKFDENRFLRSADILKCDIS